MHQGVVEDLQREYESRQKTKGVRQKVTLCSVDRGNTGGGVVTTAHGCIVTVTMNRNICLHRAFTVKLLSGYHLRKREVEQPCVFHGR